MHVFMQFVVNIVILLTYNIDRHWPSLISDYLNKWIVQYSMPCLNS